MVLIKPKFDGKDAEGNQYTGPPPVPGPYHGVIKKMFYTKIKSGPNEGADQYAVIVEIDQGKYKGAGLFHNINMLDQTAWSTNQFLDAMCENQNQRNVLRSWFWDIGCDVESQAEKLGQPVNFIGKPKFKPIGKAVSFMVKNEPDQSGNGIRAVLDRFIIPNSEEETESLPQEEDSGLEEFAPTPEVAQTPAAAEEAPPPPAAADDGDDPWS